MQHALHTCCHTQWWQHMRASFHEGWMYRASGGSRWQVIKSGVACSSYTIESPREWSHAFQYATYVE